MALCLLLRLFFFRLLRLKRFITLTLRCFDLYRYCWRPCFVWQLRSEERFSRNAETDLVCRLLLEKKNCNIGLHLEADVVQMVVYEIRCVRLLTAKLRLFLDVVLPGDQ